MAAGTSPIAATSMRTCDLDRNFAFPNENGKRSVGTCCSLRCNLGGTLATVLGRPQLTLAEGRNVSGTVGAQTADHNQQPKHKFGSHPALPVSEAQPRRTNICPRHEIDIKAQKLSRHSQDRMNYGQCVIRPMKRPGKSWINLSLECGPHHKSDHQQVQKQHRRLTNALCLITLSSSQKDPRDQRRSHQGLHDEVEIGLESGAGAEESFVWQRPAINGQLYLAVSNRQ